jgi:hypothetical protein
MADEPAMRIAGLVGLANLRPGEITSEERAAIVGVSQGAEASVEARTQLYFALGEIEERRGDADAAFVAFAAGNRLKRQTLTGEIPKPEQPPIGPRIRALDPAQVAEANRAAIAFRKAVFTREFIAEYAGRGHHIAAPIFILGMPRSGSTLIEQILSSHRRVQGLGETNAFAEAVRGRYPFDLFAPNPPNHFRGMADGYFKAMHARKLHGHRADPPDAAQGGDPAQRARSGGHLPGLLSPAVRDRQRMQLRPCRHRP